MGWLWFGAGYIGGIATVAGGCYAGMKYAFSHPEKFARMMMSKMMSKE